MTINLDHNDLRAVLDALELAQQTAFTANTDPAQVRTWSDLHQELQSAWAQELTPEEVGQLVDRNESFSGTTASFPKVQRYNDIKATLTQLLQRNRCTTALSESAPARNHRCAQLYLDLSRISILKRRDIALLVKALEKSDELVVAVCESHTPRMTFSLNGVWEP
jgi:hypothetical protein